MRRSMSHVLLVVLAAAILAGCASVPPDSDGAIMDLDADSATVSGPTADARTNPEGKPYQYRAVCLEASQHDGNAHVMSKWMDDPEEARKLGDYHGNFKEKGHHWVIERRAKQ